MRIGLISIVGEGPVAANGAARLAGRPVAWHQMHSALALRCERIVCLAEAPSPELAAIQREAERKGARFHAVAHHRGLAGLVHASDTLIVFAPGVLPDGTWLAEALTGRSGVGTFPADGTVELGFERIDRDRAWAGVLATRGDAVEALAALPPDADPIAGLLRVALQRGARAVEVPEGWLEEGRWALLRGNAGAERHEAQWYRREVPQPPIARPIDALAHRVARVIVGRGGNSRALAGGLAGVGGAIAVAGAAAGYRGYTLGGLSALALGALLSATGLALGRFARAGTGEAGRTWLGEGRRALLDLALLTVAASPVVFGGWHAAFAAAVLVAAMRLAQDDGAPPPLRPLADRTLVLLALAGLAAADRFAGGAALIGLAGLALRLFWPARRG